MNGVGDWRMKERRRGWGGGATDGSGGSGSAACLMHSPYGLFISGPQSRSSPCRHLIRMQVSRGAADRRGIRGGAAREIERPPLLRQSVSSVERLSPRMPLAPSFPRLLGRTRSGVDHFHLTWLCKRFFSEA